MHPFKGTPDRDLIMSMESAALIGMGIIAIVAMGAVALALWSAHHKDVLPKR